MIVKEERAQRQLLTHFREGSDAEAVELGLWLSTREGTDGWRVNL